MDGFLSDSAVQRALMAESGILFFSGSPLVLRLHFELQYKAAPDTRFCYICERPELLLPDILSEALVCSFAVTDLFPNIQDRKTLLAQKPNVLESLYAKNIPGFVTATDLSRHLLEIEFAARAKPTPVSDPVADLATIDPKWSSLTLTVETVSQSVLDAIRQDKYDIIRPELARLNGRFQEYLDLAYFATLHASHILAPRSVNKILPFLTFNHKGNGRVALLVVDGMAWWQYLVLREQLTAERIHTSDSTIYAWMPTITMLSRQAIFRGDDPVLDYKQSPASEEKLWSAWWTEQGIPYSDIQYIYGDSEPEIWSTTRRLALVSVTLDEVMHISDAPDLLLACTEAWARRFVRTIIALKSQGFAIYITTDHGNVLSTGAGTLSSAEKTHLFADGSRGARHLIYKDEAPMQEFLSLHEESSFLVHDNWLAYRDEQAFNKAGKRKITHGGSHLLEVAIPFITIK
jgi:hypothetical protein